MKRVGLVAATLFAIGLLIPSLRDAGAQRRFYDAPRGMYTQQLVRRIAVLERRVDRLERLLPDDARAPESVDVETAEQQVANAKQRLAYSADLFRKGYVSKAQLEAERFEFDRAEKVLQFANARRDGDSTKEIADGIAILDAEHDLAVAQRQLKVSERMTASGLTQPPGRESYQRAVDAAQNRLDAVRAQAD